MWPTFPQFQSLGLENKDEYEKLAARHAPFSDLSFTTLHIWWNLNEQLAISTLEDNLIIDYQNPHDEVNSGLCVVGDNHVFETMQTVFEYQERRQDPVRLVHVPEFVTVKLSANEKKQLKLIEELDYNEYIVDSKELASLENGAFGKIRRKVTRFQREVEGKNIDIRQLDLNEQSNRDLIYASIIEWQAKFPKANDPESTENKAILTSISHFDLLHMINLCLFVDGELQAVSLFHESHDRKYYIINHLKVDYTIPFIFDYVTHLIALLAHEHDVPFLNMEMDLGIEGLRRHKQGLRPVEFFRKYTITPADTAPEAIDISSITI